ncbi:MAG: SDR family oxidoreductase [Asgard group archaeon]|nr:SDR family oxidoreductase [Asgard group archaeon]
MFKNSHTLIYPIDSSGCMEGKIVIVTGANAGIGKATALELAKMGSHVVMVCRNMKKAEKVFLEIQLEAETEKLDLMYCDFGSLDSFNKFVKKFKSKYKRLDVLINNHGAVFVLKSKTENGFESTFAINHLGYFSLTLQLLDLLKASTPSRIVNVSSSSNYKVKKLEIDDYNWDRRTYYLMTAYAESKLYNIMFTFLLAEKLEGTGVTVNCLHPGYVKTKIGLNNFFLRLLTPIVKSGGMSIEEGAKTSVYLASSPDVKNVSGKFYAKMKEKKPNELAFDKEAQEKLWKLSLKLTDL